MKRLTILRGLPGSGKSTIAITLNQSEDAYVVSADSLHVHPDNGIYNWQPDNVHDAHTMCRLSAKFLMFHGVDRLVIDNTNTMKKEFQPYLDLAEKYGYEVDYDQPITEWAWDVEECFKRNKHNVPKEAIQRMKDRFETIQ